jgi:hypothetical protein
MAKQKSQVKANVEPEEARANNHGPMLFLRNRLADTIPLLEDNLKSLRAKLSPDGAMNKSVAKKIKRLEGVLIKRNPRFRPMIKIYCRLQAASLS